MIESLNEPSADCALFYSSHPREGASMKVYLYASPLNFEIVEKAYCLFDDYGKEGCDSISAMKREIGNIVKVEPKLIGLSLLPKGWAIRTNTEERFYIGKIDDEHRLFRFEFQEMDMTILDVDLVVNNPSLFFEG